MSRKQTIPLNRLTEEHLISVPALPAYVQAHESQDSFSDWRPNMSLITVAITLIVIGVLLWLVNTYIPMDGKIKKILNIVVVICVVGWLLVAFGVIGRSGDIRVPKIE